MTISAQVNRIAYTGDGGTVTFPFPYKFLNTADLVVTSIVTLTGVETVKTITTHYTVAGEGTDDSGEVTMLSAPASTETIMIYSDPAIAQGTDFVNGGSLDVDNYEAAYDELTLICRRLDDRLDRTLRQPEGDVADIDFIPAKVDRADMYLSFDSDGDPIANIGTLGSTVSDYWYVIFVADSEAAAHAALNLEIGTDVQAWDAQLDDLAALTPTDSNFIVGDGTNWVAETGATARTSLGVAIGVNVQAFDAQLDDLAGLAVTDSNFIVGDGVNWVVETGDTARISLGLGTTDSPTFVAVTATAAVTGDTGVFTNGASSNGNAVREVGRETIWLPAGSWTPNTTNGPAPGTHETTTNKVMLTTLDFDKDTSESAQFAVPMPKNWDKGVIRFRPWWLGLVGAGTVTFTVSGVALTDSDVLDTAFGTGISVTDTLTTIGDIQVGAESADVTIAGTPIEADLIMLRVERTISDTLTGDGSLVGLHIYINTDAGNDD